MYRKLSWDRGASREHTAWYLRHIRKSFITLIIAVSVLWCDLYADCSWFDKDCDPPYDHSAASSQPSLTVLTCKANLTLACTSSLHFHGQGMISLREEWPWTCIKLAGTEREDTEELIILQSTGSITSRHDFNRVVGMGSKEQYLIDRIWWHVDFFQFVFHDRLWKLCWVGTEEFWILF